MKMLAEDGNKKTKIICDLIDQPTKFLSTIQVGITLAGFFASASAATGISEVLGEILSSIGILIGILIGVIYMKDFIIEARKKGFENINVREILQEPFFVPECKKVQELFREFQQSKRHIAIIIDEYGGFSGILTIEDLVEEIMGEINDEDDLVLYGIIKIDNKNFLVDGVTTLEEIEDKLKVNLNSSDVDIDTISGFLINIYR